MDTYMRRLEGGIMTPTKWEIFNKKERETPKFLKAGTEIDVLVEILPDLKLEVDGRYGKHPMYIIHTKTYGAVYVSPRQFIKITDGIGDQTKGIYHTEL